MGEKQVAVQNEYEIDLKELILLFWKKKFFIAGLALAGAVIAAIISLFILKPVFHTELMIDVNVPVTYMTKYGDYTLPNSTNSQYLKLITSNDVIANTIKDMGYDEKLNTVENVKKRINIGNVDSKSTIENVFNVKVAADNAQESLKFAKALYNNYIDYIDVITKERAVDYFYNNFNAKLKSNELMLESTKAILEKNEKLLAETPETIDQARLANVGNGTVIENIINPAYTQLQESIMTNKQSIIQIEEDMKRLNNNLQELDAEKKTIDQYYETGKVDDSKSSFIDIAKNSIYLLSEPVEPLHKTSPSNFKNTLIGLILGGLLGVGAVFIKKYWQEA